MSETATREEYNAKQAELQRIESQQSDCKKQIASLDDQIDAINRAITNMENLEDSFGYEQTRLEESIHDTGEFKGENYDKLITGSGESLIQQMKDSKRMINQAADNLVDLRTKLQKEKNKQWGIFSGLADAWSSIKGWCRKHANDF